MAHDPEIEIGRRFKLERQTKITMIREEYSMAAVEVDLTGLPTDRTILIVRLPSFKIVEGVPEGIKLENATFCFVSSKEPLVAFYAIDLEPSAKVTGDQWSCSVNARCTRCPRYCLSEPCPFKKTAGR